MISRVKTLFKGNNFLIQEFNGFLPPGYKIEDDEPAPGNFIQLLIVIRYDSEPAEPQPQTDLEHARNYVRKIKVTFIYYDVCTKLILEPFCTSTSYLQNFFRNIAFVLSTATFYQ